jgi:hypothetical protein
VDCGLAGQTPELPEMRTSFGLADKGYQQDQVAESTVTPVVEASIEIKITLHKRENYQIKFVYETPCYKGATLMPVSGHVRPNKALSTPQSFWSPLSASQKEFCISRLLCCLTGWTTFHTVVADFLSQWNLPQYYIQSEFKLSDVFHQLILWLHFYVMGHKGTKLEK